MAKKTTKTTTTKPATPAAKPAPVAETKPEPKRSPAFKLVAGRRVPV